MLMLILFHHKESHISHSFCEVSKQYDDYSCALFAVQLKGSKNEKNKNDLFMLVHREVAVYTNERGKKCVSVHVCERVRACACGIFMYVCLLDISGCEVHSSGPPKCKINSSGRVM